MGISRFACALFLPLWGGTGHAAFPVDLALHPLPQSLQNSCQSYSLAFALAATGSPAFKATTAKELRDLELRVRSQIEKSAGPGGAILSHEVWRTAVKQLTADAYILDVKYLPNGEDVVEHIATATGITNASTLGPVLSAALVKEVVLISVNKLGKSAYSSGHIVPVIGINKGATSPVGLAVVNPGVKWGAKEQMVCRIDGSPGDSAYTARYSVETTYTLKLFTPVAAEPTKNGFLVMTLRKK